MKKLIGRLAGLVLLCAGLVAHADERTYTFGVVPQQAASVLAENWTPVLADISARSGLRLRFATAPNIPTFEKRLATGEYDFAYMNPYHYVVFHEKPGYDAIAREADRLLIGILVVKKDSPVKGIHDLSGQTLAFPSPAAFAATILPQAELRKEGVQFKHKYVSSHESVYLSVEKGLYPAGGGVERTFGMMPEAVRQDLRILWRTKAYSPHAIAARPGLPAEVRNKVVKAMLDMSRDPEGRALLERIGFKGVAAAADKDWDDIRRLDIHILDEILD